MASFSNQAASFAALFVAMNSASIELCAIDFCLYKTYEIALLTRIVDQPWKETQSPSDPYITSE